MKNPVKTFAVMLMLALCGASAGHAQEAEGPRTALKVCAPPFNLPMSDKDESGYENRMARLFADKLGLPLQYTWFPQRMGFVRATLRNNETDDGSYKCDLIMGVVDNFEMAATTRPYMRSAWAMVYVKGRGLDFIKSQADLKNLSAEQKKMLRLGIWDQGPTTEWIYRLGLIDNATPYPIMSGDARQGPGYIIEGDLLSDKVNLTFAWGPIAGFIARNMKDHELVVIPLTEDSGTQDGQAWKVRFDFRIAAAVRHGEDAWRKQVDALIADNQTEINSILKEYNVPLLELGPMAQKRDDDDD
ncbi:MAG: quinoprotein dehydrogenase-associated putative ABC transporter substrate-binding protein [Myxococcota bacterium]